MTILVPILGDQLSHTIASLHGVPKDGTVVLLMEVADETTYVRHHKRKIALIFSAMRHFADELRAAGWSVDYIRLDDPENSGSFSGEVARAVDRHRPSAIRIVEPGEWRVRTMIDGWAERFGLRVDVLIDDRFICGILEFQTWAQARSELVMEYFYREMRRKTGLLMTPDDKPEGGRWNLDKDNRAPPKRGLNYPEPMHFAPDETTQAVMALVADRFAEHFGRLEQFALPVTAAQAREALAHFVTTALPDFGTYQDAMVTGQDWLYHSWLSPALNLGLLTPLEVAQAAADAYAAGSVPLNAAEGFIRQIIGWREYVRGYYWLEMPDVAAANALEATRPLPDFYWTGDTQMLCLAEAVRNTRDNAYAHHIQRLMVLGNFAMLAGVRPQDVADWFLVVYADAYEWVELPNVIGMSQHADGGRLATKPYAGGGAYIDRMSDHCGKCRYDVKKKVGPDACPFNALYWDFLARHERLFGRNHRMANMYATWNRMKPEVRDSYRASAQAFLATLVPAAKGWARDSGSDAR
ncbi:cryptochrome/photolyase family protein [Sphingomonas sp. 10B4]|uniref:cryptochrome/photolyase family protein n=1 Tax=Sphingomonas sp. 10B4 TaxID=3048575 RepID=UPI002AB56146|nr:cryptochrome/photolyase family protein [Sphingomonas sp. 10B4]MDY7525290.1 cryptochrome/photolyase family protein [Sphingomonas sp. 10B4]MEB0282762.1 cryptochrome/photolyase family protein [Sphingomonas sp. 10B4]